MLYIFAGPTTVTQPAENGNKAKYLDAGEAQSLIGFGNCEHDKDCQHRKEGRFQKTFRPETVEERKVRVGSNIGRVRKAISRLASIVGRDVYADYPLLNIETGEVVEAQDVWISSNLKKDDGSPVTIDDFPENHSFGNGVSCNIQVRLRDGSIKLMSWCILTPLAHGNMNAAKRENIRAAMED